jgi:hypothetical protein
MCYMPYPSLTPGLGYPNNTQSSSAYMDCTLNLTDSWYDCFDSGPANREASTGPTHYGTNTENADIHPCSKFN